MDPHPIVVTVKVGKKTFDFLDKMKKLTFAKYLKIVRMMWWNNCYEEHPWLTQKQLGR